MDRGANILFDKIDRTILVTPLGKFRGDGGYYAILPFREIAFPCTPHELAALVFDALKKSGKTFYPLKDYLGYFIEQGDAESLRLRKKYYPSSGTTASRAKRYWPSP
jgi:hypothetical protein